MTSLHWLDVSARGRIRATGEDRKRLLHAMTTNHVQGLETGQSCYAFFLSAQGRILADAVIWDEGESLLISVEPEVRERVYQHLDKFIIADDVTLEDITTTTTEILVFGEGSPPVTPSFTVAGVAHYVAPVGGRETLIESLDSAPATENDYRLYRLKTGIPRYSDDFSDANLVQETGLVSQAVHFAKGCYLGQEIVERVRAQGQVTKTLVRLRIESLTAERGAKVMAADQEVGVLGSTVASPEGRSTLAFAIVRVKFLTGAANLQVNGAAAQVL